MPNQEDEAVVLRQYYLSEANRIIVLFTRTRGKLRVVAHGLKRPKSRLGGRLEPLTHIQIQYYLKEGADLGRVQQCSTIHSFLGKHPPLERVYAFYYIAELAQEIVQDNYPNPLLYRLLLSTLVAGEQHGAKESLLRYFEFWALRLSGFLPDYDYCSRCGKCVKDDGFFAFVDEGQVRCHSCARGRGTLIRASAAKLLGLMTELSPEKFSRELWDPQAGKDLELLTQRLLEFHLERRPKSYAVVREMLQAN